MPLRILSGIILPDRTSPNTNNNTTIDFATHTDSKNVTGKRVTIGRIGYGFAKTPARFIGLRKIKVRNTTFISHVPINKTVINATFDIDEEVSKDSAKISWQVTDECRTREIDYMFIGEESTIPSKRKTLTKRSIKRKASTKNRTTKKRKTK